MYEETGDSLAMTKAAVMKTTATENGYVEKVHENCYTFGYSKLIPFSATVNPKFGSGVWFDASLRNNQVSVVMPSGGTAVPKFAGILVRQPYIASGFPARPDTIEPQNKALIANGGYIKYKTGLAADGTTVQTFADVQVGFNMYVANATGTMHFASSDPASGYTKVGKIVRMNPDDSSFTVKLTF